MPTPPSAGELEGPALQHGYTPDFYEHHLEGARRSAEVVVAHLDEHFDWWPSTVVDVGCGRGAWAAVFAEHGCRVTGLDGSHVTSPLIDDFVVHDLGLPLPELGHFDMAVCLEVAEHLHPDRAASFVADLCRLSDAVLFSAAIPHQDGVGHVNCRWPSWWAELFAAEGYGVTGDLRWPLWDDGRIEPWYRQNLLLFVRGEVDRTGPLDVVHPEIHEWGRWPNPDAEVEGEAQPEVEGST